MIKEHEILQAGTFLKPHGINGELNLELDIDVDLSAVRCLIVEMDGIFVPFRVDGVRQKSIHTVLVQLEDVSNEYEAKQFVGKSAYLLREDCLSCEDEEDGFYVSDLIGYRLADSDGSDIGVIQDYDDSTSNVVLIVASPDGKESVYIPLVPELICRIDSDNKEIEMDLPDGLTDLNNG